jgi:D-alanine-D-alanine ligase
VSREVIAHVKKGVLADQFYAERLYTEGRIRQLLNDCNFSNIILHDNLVVQSMRNQDLGMMANRMIITADIHKSWTVKKDLKTATKSVYVVLGDPRLNDTVKPNGTFDDDDYFTINELKRALREHMDYKIKYVDDHKSLISTLISQKSKIDLVFNLCDEGFNNEAKKELHVPALFEMLDIPYTGGNPQCLAYCYDKSLIRGVAAEMDVPVPQAYIIKPEDATFMDFPLTFPVIVKPNLGDSSIGINQNSVCNDILQLEKAILHVRSTTGFDSNILIEEFLPGKDISVGIIGNMPNDYTVLPIIEEDYSALPADLPKICGYEAKWDSQSPYWKIKSIQADLPEATVQFLINSCIKLFSRLNCRDYARFDWRIDKNGTPRLLEVNPNPGWCWDGHLAKMCKIANISYAEMLNMIIKSAEQRYSICQNENV